MIENCYEVEIPECPSSIKVKGGLMANSNYFVIVTDKYGEKYFIETTTDAQGSFTLDEEDLSVFPTGSFNRHSGTWLMEVRLLLANCDNELLQFCCNEEINFFSCIQFSFFQSSLGENETEIGCICNDPVTPMPPAPGSGLDLLTATKIAPGVYQFNGIPLIVLVEGITKKANVGYTQAGNTIIFNAENMPDDTDNVWSYGKLTS